MQAMSQQGEQEEQLNYESDEQEDQGAAEPAAAAQTQQHGTPAASAAHPDLRPQQPETPAGKSSSRPLIPGPAAKPDHEAAAPCSPGAGSMPTVLPLPRKRTTPLPPFGGVSRGSKQGPQQQDDDGDQPQVQQQHLGQVPARLRDRLAFPDPVDDEPASNPAAAAAAAAAAGVAEGSIAVVLPGSGAVHYLTPPEKLMCQFDDMDVQPLPSARALASLMSVLRQEYSVFVTIYEALLKDALAARRQGRTGLAGAYAAASAQLLQYVLDYIMLPGGWFDRLRSRLQSVISGDRRPFCVIHGGGSHDTMGCQRLLQGASHVELFCHPFNKPPQPSAAGKRKQDRSGAPPPAKQGKPYGRNDRAAAAAATAGGGARQHRQGGSSRWTSNNGRATVPAAAAGGGAGQHYQGGSSSGADFAAPAAGMAPGFGAVPAAAASGPAGAAGILPAAEPYMAAAYPDLMGQGFQGQPAVAAAAGGLAAGAAGPQPAAGFDGGNDAVVGGLVAQVQQLQYQVAQLEATLARLEAARLRRERDAALHRARQDF